MSVRNLFHHEGVTDLAKMRADAQLAANRGEEVVLHLHTYDEEWDGCRPGRPTWVEHEFFVSHAAKASV